MPTISFLSGTAFDLFISLNVLHQPRYFGLRPAWAAGIRSRIALPWRATLEAYQALSLIPLAWIASLPAPRDAATALAVLESIPPAGRLPALFLEEGGDPRLRACLEGIATQRSWNAADQETLRGVFQKSGHPKPSAIPLICELWTRLEQAGSEYLAALRAYVEAFFGEEEQRIAPALEASLGAVRARAGKLPVEELVEEVSRGVEFRVDPNLAEICLAPSYWSSPLIFYTQAQTRRLLLVYGARPDEASLSADDPVPEALLRGLDALADSTRLRILFYLRQQPQTPTQLAARLRLRAPTVVHHLRQLRLAGLVRITLETDLERRYALRAGALDGLWADLETYMRSE